MDLAPVFFMDNITEICKYSKGTRPNISLEAAVQKKMKEQLKLSPTPKTYYFVHDIINPIQKYWSVVCPNVKIPPELARAFALGNRLQAFATPWFKALPGFSIDEGLLDGAFVELAGVRGRVDFLIRDSIIEFKTKIPPLPETPDDVLEKYPQDLEQIVFYSVLHPLMPEINYLVFMESERPYSIKAFKVKTKDGKLIKKIIRERISALDKALQTKNWSELGKCRYFDHNCQFKSSGSCSCEKLTPFDLKTLLSAIEVEFDSDFTKTIEDSKKKCIESSSLLVSPYELIAPRKRFLKKVRGMDTSFERPPQHYQYESCLWRTINNLRYSLNDSERQKILDSVVDKRMKIPFRWIKIPSSTHKDGEVLPYLINIINSDKQYSTTKPSKYHVAELGIICAIHGRSRGLIFNMYPRLNKFVRVFEVKYESLGQLQKFVKDQIDKIKEAERTKRFEELPPCPPFMNDDAACPMHIECHESSGKGCRD